MEEIALLIEETVSRLRGEGFENLRKLPSVSSKSVKIKGKRRTLSIWRDQLESGEVMIVAQVYTIGWLGFGSIQADGFAMNHDGLIRTLSDSEFYEFT